MLRVFVHEKTPDPGVDALLRVFVHEKTPGLGVEVLLMVFVHRQTSPLYGHLPMYARISCIRWL